jgi:hypothetical protein
VFSLDIPANNCAILQSGNDLELLPAGQHCITHPNVTLRGLYTLGENQFEMPTKDMCVLFPLLFFIFLATHDFGTN